MKKKYDVTHDEKIYAFALKRWGLEGLLKKYNKEIQRFLYSKKYDFDDYCGLFLGSRVVIEALKDDGFLNNEQLTKLSKNDLEIKENTVKVTENLYNLTAIKKEPFDSVKYWFLYRVPKEAISRLKLNVTIDHKFDPRNHKTG